MVFAVAENDGCIVFGQQLHHTLGECDLAVFEDHEADVFNWRPFHFAGVLAGDHQLFVFNAQVVGVGEKEGPLEHGFGLCCYFLRRLLIFWSCSTSITVKEGTSK